MTATKEKEGKEKGQKSTERARANGNAKGLPPIEVRVLSLVNVAADPDGPPEYINFAAVSKVAFTTAAGPQGEVEILRLEFTWRKDLQDPGAKPARGSGWPLMPEQTAQVIRVLETNPEFVRVGENTFYNINTVESILPASNSSDEGVRGAAQPGDLEITFRPIWDEQARAFVFNKTLVVAGDDAASLAKRLLKVSKQLPQRHIPTRSGGSKKSGEKKAAGGDSEDAA